MKRVEFVDDRVYKMKNSNNIIRRILVKRCIAPDVVFETYIYHPISESKEIPEYLSIEMSVMDWNVDRENSIMKYIDTEIKRIEHSLNNKDEFAIDIHGRYGYGEEFDKRVDNLKETYDYDRSA